LRGLLIRRRLVLHEYNDNPRQSLLLLLALFRQQTQRLHANAG
jgi:hypothetical protein